jgi:hypothetical protein
MLVYLCLGLHYLSASYFRLAAGRDPIEQPPRTAPSSKLMLLFLMRLTSASYGLVPA